MTEALLPVHGFVLAGGKSSRMGQDKALLPFCGVPLIEIAVAKLRSLCAEVSILGTRDDLEVYAPSVSDLRVDAGPGAAFESAFKTMTRDWALFVPVDVPLLPAFVLRRWCDDIVGSTLPCASFLVRGKDDQPAFSALHRACGPSISAALDHGERKLVRLLYAADDDAVAPTMPRNVNRYAIDATQSQLEFWFSNLNTPHEFAEAEAWARAEGWQPPTFNGMPY